MTTRFLRWLVPMLLVPAAALAQDVEGPQVDRTQLEAEPGAQPPAGPAARAAPQAPPEDTRSHVGQLGVRIGLGVPYIFAVKYGDGPRCDRTGEEFCHRVGYGLLDLELGFGVSDTVELSALVRVALAEDPASNATPLAFGLGARAYTSPSAPFKGFLGGRLMLDVTQSDVESWRTVDVGARGELGLQYDVLRYLGFYVQAGASLMLLRALHLSFDGTGGVQARFP